MKTIEQWTSELAAEEEDRVVETAECSGGCGKHGELNYAWPPTKDEPDEFYCGGSPRCCP